MSERFRVLGLGVKVSFECSLIKGCMLKPVGEAVIVFSMWYYFSNL